ncbi:MAG: nuclear transport factor 2 family protein [Gammaproteobacteria bacterium]
MTTTEKQLAELLAREAIRELPLRYCDCVWRDDVDGLADLFTTDASFVTVIGERTVTVSGRDNIRAMFATALDIRPRPYIHNHVFEIVADGFASGRAYLDLRSARNNMEFLGAGYYEDEYMATPDGWKFHRRKFVALRMDELPDVLKSA